MSQAAKDKAIDALVASWYARLQPFVVLRVDDARAHAEKALTDALKATPDGRRSLAKLAGSRSLKAANDRLDDVTLRLAGKSDKSLKGRLRDARAEMYALAAAWQFKMIPAAIRSWARPEPAASYLAAARAAAVHGYDPHAVVSAAVATQKITLKAALERGGRADATGKQAGDILDGWETQAKGALSRTLRSLLVDSAGWCDTQAAVDMIDPEYLD